MDRYSRQSLFKHIKPSGTAEIQLKTVLIVGVGALGTVSGDMLTRAGVQKLILIDRDYVEFSNLQRQSLYHEGHATEQMPKVIAAKNQLTKIRADIDIEVHLEHCDGELLESLVEDVDLILDGTDNFETRMLINDVAYKHNIPWVYAACVEATYASMAFIPKETPCFRCLTPVLPSATLTCDTAGIISPAVHTAVSLQVTSALKILTNTLFTPKFVMGDLWEQEHVAIKVHGLKRDMCETCGHHPTYPSLNNESDMTMSLCGRDTVQMINMQYTHELLRNILDDKDINYKTNPYFISFNFDGYRIVVFKNGRILIHGVSDIKKAKTIMDQLFG